MINFMMGARPLYVPQRLTVTSVNNTTAANQDQFGALVGYYQIYASGGGGGGGGAAFVTPVLFVGERGARAQSTSNNYIFLAQNVLTGTQLTSPVGGTGGASPGISGDDTATNGSNGGPATLNRVSGGFLTVALGGAGGRAGKISTTTDWNPTPQAAIFPFESEIGSGGKGADGDSGSEAGDPGRVYLVKLA